MVSAGLVLILSLPLMATGAALVLIVRALRRRVQDVEGAMRYFSDPTASEKEDRESLRRIEEKHRCEREA